MRIRLRSRRTPTLTGTCHPGEPLACQIQPVRVEEFDQRNLLRSSPPLELPFAIYCLLNFVERFPIQQPLNSIFVRESFNAVKFVLEEATVEIARHADVERPRQAAHDVHAVRLSLVRHGRG